MQVQESFLVCAYFALDNYFGGGRLEIRMYTLAYLNGNFSSLFKWSIDHLSTHIFKKAEN